MPGPSIDDVLERLDSIVRESRSRGNRNGFFAALYRRVTRAVQLGIRQGRFADGARMELLDVNFAARYLEAYDLDRRGGRPAESWQVAFEAAGQPGRLVLQHLLAGMNAHINLDLGIAAARTCPGGQLDALRPDFDVINDILVEQIDGVEAAIASVSPWIGILDWVGGRKDEITCNFSIRAARRLAWKTAEQLAPLAEGEQNAIIAGLDGIVAALGRRIIRPGPVLATVNWLILRAESKDVPGIIDALSGSGRSGTP